MLDWTAVTDAGNFLYTPYDGVPRWIEKIKWGPGLTNLVGVGSGAFYGPDDDLCGDGKGDLDLRGWCVSNIASKPTRFFNPSPTNVDSTFNTIKYPLWGECPTPIESWVTPDSMVVLDVRLVDDLDEGDLDNYRHFTYSGTANIYPIREFGGELRVMPDLNMSSAGTFVIPVEDIPAGYLFVGTPTAFGFGDSISSNNTNDVKPGIAFGELTDTSLWENNKIVFKPFRRIVTGLQYINTSKFKSLDHAFYSHKMYKSDPDIPWKYTTQFPWHETANWDTSNVTNFNSTLHRMTPDVPKVNWDFSNAVTMESAFTTSFGFPDWIEDIQFGPNLTSLKGMGNGFTSDYPIKGDYENNYYVGQKRPFDLSKWNVVNITSKPSAFFTPNPFDANMISSWIIQPNWGTDGT